MYISKLVNLYLLAHIAVLNIFLIYINVFSESWWEAGMYNVVLMIIVYFFCRDFKNHNQGRQYRLDQDRVHTLFDNLTEEGKRVRATERSNGKTYLLFYEPTKRTGFLKLRSPEIRWVVEAEYPEAFSPDDKSYSTVRWIGFRSLGTVTYSIEIVEFDKDGDPKNFEPSPNLSLSEWYKLHKTPAALYLSIEEIQTIESSLTSIPKEDWIELEP